MKQFGFNAVRTSHYQPTRLGPPYKGTAVCRGGYRVALIDRLCDDRAT